MTDELPTVTVIRDGQPVRVNMTDYDAKRDELAQAPVQQADALQAEALAVVKRGRKWFVTDPTGADVKIEGIDAGGYKDENEAWGAILAVNSNG